MTPRSRRTPPTMSFSERCKILFKNFVLRVLPATPREEKRGIRVKRKGNATLSCALDVVRYLIRCPFEKTSRARYSRKIVYFSAVLAPTHTRVARKKKNETFSLLSSLSHLARSFYCALVFLRVSPRGVRVGGCVFLFVRRSVCATPKAKGTTTTRQKGKRVQDVEDQDDNKRWATRFRAR